MDSRNVARLGSTTPTPTVQPSTINERMNKVAVNLMENNARVESMLARINGTPPSSGENMKATTQPGLPPMTSSLCVLEEQCERLFRLVEGLEQVA